jgi:hypothetical protein
MWTADTNARDSDPNLRMRHPHQPPPSSATTSSGDVHHYISSTPKQCGSHCSTKASSSVQVVHYATAEVSTTCGSLQRHQLSWHDHTEVQDKKMTKFAPSA